MNRRLVLFTLCAPLAAQVRAHHGWASLDLKRPLYLEGVVRQVGWRNPHAQLELELPEPRVLPADLARRSVPAQVASVDGPALLRAATLPARPDRLWHIELAPISRMDSWKVEPIAVGQTVAVLGYGLPREQGKPMVRAEYLWVGEKVYALRSPPA